jgi:hypothetical protein
VSGEDGEKKRSVVSDAIDVFESRKKKKVREEKKKAALNAFPFPSTLTKPPALYRPAKTLLSQEKAHRFKHSDIFQKDSFCFPIYKQSNCGGEARKREMFFTLFRFFVLLLLQLLPTPPRAPPPPLLKASAGRGSAHTLVLYLVDAVSASSDSLVEYET